MGLRNQIEVSVLDEFFAQVRKEKGTVFLIEHSTIRDLVLFETKMREHKIYSDFENDLNKHSFMFFQGREIPREIKYGSCIEMSISFMYHDIEKLIFELPADKRLHIQRHEIRIDLMSIMEQHLPSAIRKTENVRKQFMEPICRIYDVYKDIALAISMFVYSTIEYKNNKKVDPRGLEIAFYPKMCISAATSLLMPEVYRHSETLACTVFSLIHGSEPLTKSCIDDLVKKRMDASPEDIATVIESMLSYGLLVLERGKYKANKRINIERRAGSLLR